jgi:methylthioribose-1-phosphate isomerase
MTKDLQVHKSRQAFNQAQIELVNLLSEDQQLQGQVQNQVISQHRVDHLEEERVCIARLRSTAANLKRKIQGLEEHIHDKESSKKHRYQIINHLETLSNFILARP